jgi:non-canonical purine NTP pyrophosphatase (RdgB/HAM1 family)
MATVTDRRYRRSVAGVDCSFVVTNRILFATRNAHKTRELSDILGSEFAVRDLHSVTDIPVAEETGRTFAENATLKAVSVSQAAGEELVVADDSGLEVDALEGEPGIFSARFAGENATDWENVEKLLRELTRRVASFPSPARFRCVIALARHGRLLCTFDGTLEGAIVAVPRGTDGFGYDPVFVPSGFSQTVAELRPEQKNRISHRAAAARELSVFLKSIAPP